MFGRVISGRQNLQVTAALGTKKTAKKVPVPKKNAQGDGG